MVIYFLMILFIMILSKTTKDNKMIFCILSGLILFLVIALKDPFLGKSDTLTIYYPSFKNIIGKDFNYVFYRYKEESLLFYTLTKVITLFTTNISIYYSILSLPLILGVTNLIYKHSKYPCLSFILFICLNYYFFSFIALKFSVSLGFILFALDAFLDKKNFRCLFLILIATMFHYTSIVFLLIFISDKIKFNKHFLFLLVFAVIFIYFNRDNIFQKIFLLINSGRYYAYYTRVVTLDLMSFIINFMFLLFSSLFSSDLAKHRKELTILTIGTFFSSLTIILAEFIRISMLFTIIIILLVPNVIVEKNKNKEFFLVTIILLSVLYCFISVIPNLGLNHYSLFFN